jgi:hypothetical protein
MEYDVDGGNVIKGAKMPEWQSCVVYFARVITVRSLIRFSGRHGRITVSAPSSKEFRAKFLVGNFNASSRQT